MSPSAAPTSSDSPLVARVKAALSRQSLSPEATLEAMEARLGAETDPQRIVILAREIEAFKAKTR